MSEDTDPPRKPKIGLHPKGLTFYKKIGQEDRSVWGMSMRLMFLRDLLDCDHESVSELVLRGIRRSHDDLMVRMAMQRTRTRRDMEEKVELLNEYPPADDQNMFLPEMISAALSENQLYLALPDLIRRPRRKR